MIIDPEIVNKKDKKVGIKMNCQKNNTDNMKITNDELNKYITKLIQYHYNLNDGGHDISHAEYVIIRSMKFANNIENINKEMVYVIAAYHDVAHHIDAKNHESISSKMLLEDTELKKIFYRRGNKNYE